MAPCARPHLPAIDAGGRTGAIAKKSPRKIEVSAAFSFRSANLTAK
jgi:hypothetical protein